MADKRRTEKRSAIETEYRGLLKVAILAAAVAWPLAAVCWLAVGVIRSFAMLQIHPLREPADLWDPAWSPNSAEPLTIVPLALALPIAFFVASSLRPVEELRIDPSPREGARDALSNDLAWGVNLLSSVGLAMVALNAVRQGSSVLDILVTAVASAVCSAFAALHRDSHGRVALSLEQTRSAHGRVVAAIEALDKAVSGSPSGRPAGRSRDYAVEAALVLLPTLAIGAYTHAVSGPDVGILVIAASFALLTAALRRSLDVDAQVDRVTTPGFISANLNSALAIILTVLNVFTATTIGGLTVGPAGAAVGLIATCVGYGLFLRFRHSRTIRTRVSTKLRLRLQLIDQRRRRLTATHRMLFGTRERHPRPKAQSVRSRKAERAIRT